MKKKPLLEVNGLAKHFATKRGWLQPSGLIHAVNEVSFTIEPGETLGLVGESGSGKSTVGQMIMRLLTPTAGEIRFDGKNIASMSKAESFDYARRVQIVFQDPYSSLNPQKVIGDTLARPLVVHGLARGRQQVRQRTLELLTEVGLKPAESFIGRYPHQMSGGERQRAAIARAIAVRPDLIVADEAVSSLDVSIRAQLLNLMRELQRKHNLAYLFITHDLAILRQMSHRAAVMYLGKVVEAGPTQEVIDQPAHPYTRALLSAVPLPDPVRTRNRQAIELRGPMPSPVDMPDGCAFHPRCPNAREECAAHSPDAVIINKRRVTCLPDVIELHRSPGLPVLEQTSIAVNAQNAVART